MGEEPKQTDLVQEPILFEPSLPSDPSARELEWAEATLQGLAEVFPQKPMSPQCLTDEAQSSSSFNEEVRYRSLVDQLPAVVFMATLDGGIGDSYVSPQIEAALGYSQDEWLRDPIRWYQHIHPDDKERWSTDAAEMFISGTKLKTAYRVIARDGRVVWFQCEVKMLRTEDGRPWAIHGVGFDITELKESERALLEKSKQLQLHVDIATRASQATNIADAMKSVLELVREFLGWPLGHACLSSSDPKQALSCGIWSFASESRFNAFREVSEAGGLSMGSCLPGRVLASARLLWVGDVMNDSGFSRRSEAREAGIRSAFAFPVLIGNEVAAVLEFFTDVYSDPNDALLELMAHVGTQLGQVMERVRAQEKLLHDAFHDPLTALPNRALFLHRLDRAIARGKRYKGCSFAVLFIDIDRFKMVNDSLGHSAGDDLIVQVSQRILSSLRLEDIVARPVATPGSEGNAEEDTLARLGGDEFTVLLDDIRDPSDSIRVAERIQQSFATPFAICGKDIFASASIGITTNSQRATAAEVLRDADTAMYRAKLHGSARYEMFDHAMHEQAVDRLQLETDLHAALDREEFRVYYQPIVSLQSGTIAGFEALVRWERPGAGMVPPQAFVRVLEDTGLIVPVGEWILRKACEQTHRWHLLFPREQALTMSVNVSGRQFAQTDLVTRIEKILRETEVEPRAIKLEITESVTMGDPERSITVIKELKKLGLRISIDDFGTGYSSLSYLRRFPIDTLKIDRSFVTRLESNSDNREIVRTIVGLARNLGMDLVAEGTETMEEIRYLKSLNCEFAQGYYFSRPLDSDHTHALLSESRVFDLH